MVGDDRIRDVSGKLRSVHVFLAHHGEAVAPAADSRQPLSSHGREQVERIAATAAARGVRPDVVWHSGKLRGRQGDEVQADGDPLERVIAGGLHFHSAPAYTRPEACAASSASVSWRSTRSRPASQKPGSARSIPTILPSSSGLREPPADSSSR